MIRKKGFRVRPISTVDIRSTANDLRKIFGLTGGIKVAKLIEHVLPNVLPDFYYDILEKGEMGADHARTYPDKQLIEIRKDVYENADKLDKSNCDMYGRDNFTLAHELGHLILHRGVASFARTDQKNFEIYEDSEWQADTFAAEFLMPFDQIAGLTPRQIQQKFLVSHSAAINRIKYVCK